MLVVVEARPPHPPNVDVGSSPHEQSERARVCTRCLLFRMPPLPVNVPVATTATAAASACFTDRAEGHRLSQFAEVALRWAYFEICVFPVFPRHYPHSPEGTAFPPIETAADCVAADGEIIRRRGGDEFEFVVPRPFARVAQGGEEDDVCAWAVSDGLNGLERRYLENCIACTDEEVRQSDVNLTVCRLC
jgi:hypothetical protein